jgi:hypothetical protein
MSPKARGGKQVWSLSPLSLVGEVGVKATSGLAYGCAWPKWAGLSSWMSAAYELNDR